jgi:SAM-dependent methyltransferase
MNLRRLRAHWDAWGREDPLWAVLTHPQKRYGGWDPETFFATGSTQIESIMGELRRLVPNMRTSTALDFGCGVGRLTQALAVHFDHVIGVDIAPSMIASAQRWNRHGTRCRYVVNLTDTLVGFDDGSVDLVLSLITLQHMEPRYAKHYIAEFVRVTASGGLIYFQIPTDKVQVPQPPQPYQRLKARLRAAVSDRLVFLYDDLKGIMAGAGPRMEGYGIREDEVVATIERAGARVLQIREDDSAGPRWNSRRYCALKSE